MDQPTDRPIGRPNDQPTDQPIDRPGHRPTDRPAMRVTGPTIDAAKPVELARFYEEMLGWPVVESENGDPDGHPDDAWVKLRAPDDSMKLEIQWDPHYRPPVWPSDGSGPSMMMHLDIGVDDLEAGIAWAVRCGAVEARHQPQDGVRVMLDPAGHPFCLFEL